MSKIQNLKISIKLMVAFAAIIVVILGSNGTTYRNLSFIEESNGWTNHTYEVLETINKVMASMVDQETGVRGFLVSGDEGFLEPYNGGIDAYEAAFAHVKDLTSDNAAQQKRLGQLDALAKEWRTTVAEREIALMSQFETREQARAMESSGAGKKTMDGVRGLVAEIDKVERDLLVERSDAQASAFTASSLALLIGSVVSLLIAVGAGYLLTLGIANQIKKMTDVMGRLAAGEKDVDIPGTEQTDEVGQMAQALEVFKENAVEAERLREEQEQAKTDEAERDRQAQEEKAAEEARKAEEARTQQEETEKRMADLNEICSVFETKAQELLAAVASGATELDQTARAMSDNAEMTQEQAAQGASASTQASANVQTVASATEELSSSISEIARQVTDSSEIANKGAEDAASANEKIRTLAESAATIGDVIDLISDIANQTNLLSLNATIEAARAGDAGKGFAVVASEVKNLAGQTEKATEDIRTQIEAIQSRTEDAVEAIDVITGVIGQINDTSASIASAVEEQGAATQDIARSVEEAAAGTNQVSSNIDEVSQAATQTGAAANQVLATSTDLSQRSSQLQKEVEDFLSKLKAA